MKIPNLFPRKKLRATTARRSLGLPDDVDYEEMSEPNMKLSRALLIVLVLHVVAVAGIIAFNTIKTRQAAVPGPPLPASSESSSPVESAPKTAASASPAVVKHDATKPTHGPEKIVGKVGPRIEPAKPVEKASAPATSTKSYVVAKGDNPLTIAKKFKVPYDTLMAANHIEDAHKLKIGQKLIIPTKPVRKAKKADE